MTTPFANPTRLVALLVLGAAHASALAQSRGLSDDGGFFTVDATKTAETVIKRIQVVHQKDLRIETFAQIPKDLQPRFQQLGKAQFFEQWADDRARKQAVDGVYILLCKQPGHLQVWVGNNTARRLFTAADRDQLAQKLADQFRQHRYDEGLVGAVRFVQRQMDDRSKASDDGKAPLSHSDAGADPCVRPLSSTAQGRHGGLPLRTSTPTETSIGDPT